MKLLTLSAIALLASSSFALAQGGDLGAHFLENWDLDGDGQVTIAEAIEKRDTVFLTFDADDNGVLDNEEYDTFDEARANDVREHGGAQGQGNGNGNGQGNGKAMGQNKGRDSIGNAMMREFTDANKDGQVTLQEFIDSVPAWHARADRNDDGVITSADFGRH